MTVNLAGSSWTITNGYKKYDIRKINLKLKVYVHRWTITDAGTAFTIQRESETLAVRNLDGGGPMGQVIVTNNRLKGVAGVMRDQNPPANHLNGLPVVYGNIADSVCTSVVGGRGNLLTYWHVSGTVGLFGHMTGTIAPEGTVTAPPGTRYDYQNGDASVTFVKGGGTANTGWHV